MAKVLIFRTIEKLVPKQEWYEKGYPVIINVFNGSEYVNTILISISFIPLIISGISFVSIFIFKNRKSQIKLTQLSFRLSLVMSLFTIFYFYNCLSYLTELMPSKFLELLIRIISRITRAAIDSTIGTALGTTQGSCLPFPEIFVSFPALSIVF